MKEIPEKQRKKECRRQPLEERREIEQKIKGNVAGKLHKANEFKGNETRKDTLYD